MAKLLKIDMSDKKVTFGKNKTWVNYDNPKTSKFVTNFVVKGLSRPN